MAVVLHGHDDAAFQCTLCKKHICTDSKTKSCTLSSIVYVAGGYVKSIVSLGWSIWTCTSKTLQVYADQGSLLGSQEAAADLARQLTAAEAREANVKSALANEHLSRQAEATQAAARADQALSDAKEAEEKVSAAEYLSDIHHFKALLFLTLR